MRASLYLCVDWARFMLHGRHTAYNATNTDVGLRVKFIRIIISYPNILVPLILVWHASYHLGAHISCGCVYLDVILTTIISASDTVIH